MDHRRLQALHGSFNADAVTRLVMDAERLCVLWVGEGRSRAALKPFFDLLGEEGCRRIEAVAMVIATFFWTPTSLSGHTVLKVPG